MQMLMHCPSCQAQVTLPPGSSGKAARCPHCKNVFRVPRKDDVLEDTVACWLDEAADDEPAAAHEPAATAARNASAPALGRPQSPVGPEDDLAPPAHTGVRPHAPGSSTHPSSVIDAGVFNDTREGSTADLPDSLADAAAHAASRTVYTGAAPAAHQPPRHAHDHPPISDDDYRRIHRDAIRLSVLAVSAAGIRLAFAANLLKRRAFRASMPFVCINCAAADPHQLVARPLAWLDKATGKFTNAAELEALYEIHLRSQTRASEVLDGMRPIEELPPPFNDPMPYFVCTKCAPEVRIHCETVATPDGVHCEVIIPDGQYALHWLGRVNGVCGDEYARLEQEVTKFDDDSWRNIPEDIRKRIGGWFDFQGTERFLAYFPDSDFGRKDHGLAGIVLTDQRLVFCKYHHHGSISLLDREPILAVRDGQFFEILHHRRKMLRLRRDDTIELMRLLEGLKCPLQLSWT